MTDTNAFNNLLFDTSSGLLMSICCNLIYDPTDQFCQKNASCVMEYFSAYGKMQDLFIWAFEKEYLEKRNARDEVETYKFFTAFNYLYAIDNFFDYSKEVIKPLFEDRTMLDSIDIDLFRGNLDEYTKEMNEKYYKNIQDLLKMIQILKNGFEVYLRLIPMNYFTMLNGISKLLDNPIYKKKGFNSSLFGKIIKLTVTNFMKNKRMLRRAFQNTDQYIEKIGFVADTLEKMLNKCNEPYVMHLVAVAHNLEEFMSIETILEHSKYEEKQQTQEVCQMSSNELASLIKCNILPIKRMLSPLIRVEVSKALSLSGCSSDDFLIYTNVLRSFETFSREFYTYFKAVCSEEESKLRQLNSIKEKVCQSNNILKEKKIKNMKLKEQLQQLCIKKGIHNFSDILLKTTSSTSGPLNIQSNLERHKGKLNESTQQQKLIMKNEIKKVTQDEKKAEKKRKAEQKKMEKEEKKRKKEEEKKSKKDVK
ncbi:hypothetical protein ENUP19_0371G0017 [Entamoeba nuttalli]|uniref:Uncharacterized protein n=2 Tax=Entamoeba nuttalli TaxID=412467 RepID=K2HBY4_ENTNP|nr:hypothetical protein ENU1_100830 [Entamoeba nuttalli P19]EKE40144.1 hypothetical protein ENU1_100830 [Entamoeba nuttalli P19]|eukprot:XP_008857524.1 hypothetical protein ENU1_100830 [Entamoeba nuttalli P19]